MTSNTDEPTLDDVMQPGDDALDAAEPPPPGTSEAADLAQRGLTDEES